MNEEINQDNIFVIPKKEKAVAKLAVEKVIAEKSIPIGYVPVNFICKDKLGPSVLHFRNYTMEELLELSSSNENNQFYILVNKVLNNLVYENFDCCDLHIEQIKQILLTIYANFWGPKLINKPYYKDLEGDFQSKENVGYTDIEIKKLKDIRISDEFKEPFTITDNKTSMKVEFILPRVSHMFLADTFVKEFYLEKDKKYEKLESILKFKNQLENGTEKQKQQAESITYDKLLKEEYDEYLIEKNKTYLKVLQCQLIKSVNNKELKTIEEKLEAYKKEIDITTWTRYKKTIDKYATFGIDDNYTFIDENGKEITRGFSFRCLDFIPSMEFETDTGYTVQFND